MPNLFGAGSAVENLVKTPQKKTLGPVVLTAPTSFPELNKLLLVFQYQKARLVLRNTVNSIIQAEEIGSRQLHAAGFIAVPVEGFCAVVITFYLVYQLPVTVHDREVV